MKLNDMKKNKWIWYCLYSVILVLFFLYILFPSKDIGDYFIRSVQNISPDFNIDFEKISPVFPPGLKFKNVRIFKKNSPEIAVFQSKQISVKPKLLSCIKGDTRYTFNAKLNEGRITGSIQSMKLSAEKTVEISMDMEDIIIHNNSGIPSIINDRVEGILNGTISYSGKIDAPVNGSGEGEITISKGILKLTHPLPVLDLDAIEFDECAMVAQLKGRRLNITSGTLKGKDMIGNMTGSISLKGDIPESRLNLKGEIEIYPSLFQNSPEIRDAVNQLKKGMKDGKLSFNITGTIDRPEFNFN